MTGKEITITVGDKQYTFSRFNNQLRQEYIDWAKKQLPDPFDGLAERIKNLPEKYADQLFEEAKEKLSKRGSLNDPDLAAFARTPEAVIKMLQLCLRKYHADLSEGDVIDLANQLYEERGEEAFEGIFPHVQGRTPLSEEAVERDFLSK